MFRAITLALALFQAIGGQYSQGGQSVFGNGGPAAGLTAPSLVSGTPVSSSANYNGTGANVTVTVPTVTTGDNILVQCASELGTDTFSTPTSATIGTFSAINDTGTGSSAGTAWATATSAGSGSSVVITIAISGSTSDHKGCTVYAWEHTNGFGASFNSIITSSAGSAYSAPLTTVSAHSAIVWTCSDFAAGAVTSVNATPNPTATKIKVQDGSRYTNYVQYFADQAAAGAVSVGVSGAGTSAGPYNCMGNEVKGQ